MSSNEFSRTYLVDILYFGYSLHVGPEGPIFTTDNIVGFKIKKIYCFSCMRNNCFVLFDIQLTKRLVSFEHTRTDEISPVHQYSKIKNTHIRKPTMCYPGSIPHTYRERQYRVIHSSQSWKIP
jgi:hypothetical protein